MRRNDLKEYLQFVKEYKETNNKRLKGEIWGKLKS